MLNTIFGSLVVGYAVALLVYSLIKTVKRCDVQHGLPEKLSPADCFCLFLCGASSYQGITVTSAILFCVTVYIAFMAYTDKHTRKVYSFASYVLFIPGLCALIFPNIRKECIIPLIVYVGMVLFGFIIKAYHFGDVEVYIALAPYFMLIPPKTVLGIEISNFLMLLLLFLFSIIITVLFSIKILPFRVEKKRPMVPAIAFVLSFMLFVFKFA